MGTSLDAALSVSLETYENEIMQHIEASDIRDVQAASELHAIQVSDSYTYIYNVYHSSLHNQT